MQFTIPDKQIEEILDEFCDEAGYSDQVTDNVGGWLPNPESKLDFFTRIVAGQLGKFIAATVRDNRVKKIGDPIIKSDQDKAAPVPIKQVPPIEETSIP